MNDPEHRIGSNRSGRRAALMRDGRLERADASTARMPVQERGAEETLRQEDRVPGVGRGARPSDETVDMSLAQADAMIAESLLIDAAPDLLTALRDLMEALDEDRMPAPYYLARARAAIAQATGKFTR